MIINNNDLRLNFTSKNSVYQRNSSSTCPSGQEEAILENEFNEGLSSYGKYLTFKGVQKKENCDFLSRIPKNHFPKKVDIMKIREELKNGGVLFCCDPSNCYDSDKIGKMCDNGQFIGMKNSGTSYYIETPADNPFGYSDMITYDKYGNLESEEWIVKNKDGTYDNYATDYENGKPVSHAIIHAINGKILSMETIDKNGYDIIEYKYINKRCVKEIMEKRTPAGRKTDTIFIYNDCEKQEHNDIKYDTLEELAQRVPDGYFYDSDKNELIKVNKDEIKVTNDFGEIIAEDSSGNRLGSLEFTIYGTKGEDIYFSSYGTNVNGLGVGKKIMDKMIEISEGQGKGLIALALGGCVGDAGILKKANNMGFYYKMGFRAADEGTDKLIKQFISKGYEIPMALDEYVLIRYVGEPFDAGIS